MRRITISVDEDIDLIFRKLASQKYKFEQGWYSKAIKEAMELWINQIKSENNVTYDKKLLTKIQRTDL